MSEPTPLAIEEYRALRATIRERGTLRLAVLLITFLAWSALTISILAMVAIPIVGLVPLVVLAAGFEVAFATHVGVERVGRFIQVHYENADVLPAWERTTMGLPTRARRPHLDPLLGGLFTVATLLNMVPIVLLSIMDSPVVAGVPLEPAVYGMLHAVFIGRVIQARRYAATQHARDLSMFESLRESNNGA